jgi:flagellar basal body rod protein FlgB/type III secretion system FlhB-like substrate exporter
MAIGADPIFSMLRTGLEWAQLRQRVLAENVANADTPQFRPRDLAPLTFDFKIVAHRQWTNGRRCAAGGEGGVHHNEDDPTIKGKLKQMSNAKVRKRERTCRTPPPSSRIRRTTPIALQYARGVPAPVCVAKSVDALAMKIREVAGEHRIPIVENPPLARALHATVEVDQAIPPEH